MAQSGHLTDDKNSGHHQRCGNNTASRQDWLNDEHKRTQAPLANRRTSRRCTLSYFCSPRFLDQFLRNLQLHLAGLRMQRPVIAANPRVLAALAAFIAGRSAQPIRVGVEHRIQRFLNRPPHHLAKMGQVIQMHEGRITWPISSPL